jgi:hypothetical protein
MDSPPVQAPRRHPFREACAHCGSFVTLVAAGGFAWYALTVICSRIH